MQDATVIKHLEDGRLTITHTGSEYQLTHCKLFEDFVSIFNLKVNQVEELLSENKILLEQNFLAQQQIQDLKKINQSLHLDLLVAHSENIGLYDD